MIYKEYILNHLKTNQEYYRKRFGVHFIGLFGSFSRGEETADSDIDILYEIEKDKKLSMFKYLKLTKELEEHFDKKIDLVRNETLKPQIKEYILRDISYV